MMTRDPKHTPDGDHAVLVEVTRGPIVESVHYGAVAVCSPEGELLAWAGNPGTVTYLRSSSKPIQAIPLVESGAADHFGLTDAEIAVVCGSHGGEDIHVEVVSGLLAKIGLSEEALACGAHVPYDKAAAHELAERGESPTPLHNNCSGKHGGMLALAKFHGWPVGGYEMAQHPVQQAMLQVVAEFAGLSPEEVAVGVDGCSVCTFGMPLHQMATSFARLAQPDYWPEPRRAAIKRILTAIARHPEMIAGTSGNLDTDMIRASGGAVIGKAGAEGLFCGAKVATENAPAVGFALKLLDGDRGSRARNPSTVEGLRQAGILDEDLVEKLESYWMEEVRNRPGDVVGMVRPAFTLTVL